MPNKPILCVDFDGVIHSYTSKWVDAITILDPPVPGALRWLLKASEHFSIHIYSSRSKAEGGRLAMMRWLIAEALSEMSEKDAEKLNSLITYSYEKPAAFLTIDDRALCFDGDWDKIDPVKLLEFKPWNKRG